jgi:hypothetical protein
MTIYLLFSELSDILFSIFPFSVNFQVMVLRHHIQTKEDTLNLISHSMDIPPNSSLLGLVMDLHLFKDSPQWAKFLLQDTILSQLDSLLDQE